jgi:hypothetical protein
MSNIFNLHVTLKYIEMKMIKEKKRKERYPIIKKTNNYKAKNKMKMRESMRLRKL